MAAVHGGLRIAAADAAAGEAGVVPGLPLAEARARAPALGTAEADPQGDLRTLEGLADWCTRYTPWAAVDGNGHGLWLDVSGSSHLFGGEAALLETLVARLGALGFAARAALADSPGAAWAVARFAKLEGSAAVVPPQQGRRVLAPLPVAGLRLPPPTCEGLQRVGLRRIGDLMALPRAPLAARFGQATLGRLDQALGLSDEPISPRRPVPPLHVRMAFAEPVGRAEDIAAAVQRLLHDLCTHLKRAHEGARRLELVLHRIDGSRTGAAVGTSRPVHDPGHLERLFREKLGRLDSGFGVEVMALAATALAPLAPTQMDLENHTRDDGVDRLVDRLGNRFGPEGVLRLLPRASHIPERACREASALAAAPPPGDWPSRPRPIHLLPWPEPIEAMAPLPDHPPVMFRWRRARHRVARADGPERIAPEWWIDGAPPPEEGVRDYYRVEDTVGQRFWLFRQGLYRPDVAPRWYLHGFFA